MASTWRVTASTSVDGDEQARVELDPRQQDQSEADEVSSRETNPQQVLPHPAGGSKRSATPANCRG